MQPGIVPVSPEFVAALASQEVKAGDAAASHVANAGLTAMMDGHYVAAEKALRDALAIDPTHIGLLNHLASTVKCLGRDHEAMALYHRALAVNPQNQKIRNNLAVVQLRQSAWRAGWENYEARMKANKKFYDLPHPLYIDMKLREVPVATMGEIREAGYVVLAREQGIGDELFFLRWVPILRDLTNYDLKVYYSSSPKLRALLAQHTHLRLEPISSAPSFPDPPVVPIGSLPLVTGGYMARSPVWIHGIESKMQKAPRLLGVTWRAGIQGSRHLGGLDKSVPLEQLAVALSVWDGDIVAIQHDATEAELNTLRELSGKTVTAACHYNALRKQCELLSTLSEYVGVSNTNTHLYAGLGRTGRVLCPYPSEWRWGAAGPLTQWFPHFRVYRQTPYPLADWGIAMSGLRESLRPRHWWERAWR